MIDEYLGLHERIEIIYVVDGFEATYAIQDGDKILDRQHGQTIQEALDKLEIVLKEKEEDNMRLLLNSLHYKIRFTKDQLLNILPEITERELNRILIKLQADNKIKFIQGGYVSNLYS